MPSLMRRLVWPWLIVDLLFKALVGAGFLFVSDAIDGPRLMHTAAAAPFTVLPIFVAWFCAMVVSTRPIQRYARGHPSMSPEDRKSALRVALARAGRLPLLTTAFWSAQWVSAAFTLTVVVGDPPSWLAIFLFLNALLFGPIPVGHGLATFAVGPITQELDTHARQLGLTEQLPKVSLRAQILAYAFSIAWAPSAYMAAIAIAGAAADHSASSISTAMFVGFGAVGAFAVISAFFMSAAISAPLVEMTRVVERIAAKGSVAKEDRVPIQRRDELGAVVALTNGMFDRLASTQSELQSLAQSLEVRAEETRKKLEAEMQTRSRVETELDLARQIQTSVLPRKWEVPGVEVAASMHTASEVGGDYYDILPTRDGAWLGIGDVSGHGLGAGLFMLMLQSATAALVRNNASASARELVVAINTLLYENIRERARGDDFVTFTLLHYEAGRVRFAGAHEDVIVFRQATGRCERIATPGTWLGARKDIAEVTVESEFRITEGDVLVLYTDGLTEAAHPKEGQFGIDRLCGAIEKAAATSASAEAIRAQVISEAMAWCGAPQDDISLVVARQR